MSISSLFDMDAKLFFPLFKCSCILYLHYFHSLLWLNPERVLAVDYCFFVVVYDYVASVPVFAWQKPCELITALLKNPLRSAVMCVKVVNSVLVDDDEVDK